MLGNLCSNVKIVPKLFILDVSDLLVFSARMAYGCAQNVHLSQRIGTAPLTIKTISKSRTGPTMRVQKTPSSKNFAIPLRAVNVIPNVNSQK